MIWRLYSASIAPAARGEPIVERALVLMLRGSHFEAGFLPTSPLSEPEVLEGVHLLLLTPELSSGCREFPLTVLGGTLRTAEILILKLVAYSVATREGGAWVGSERVVPGPCSSTEELERQIEAALLANPRANQAAH